MLKIYLLNLLLLIPAPQLRAGTALLWIPREHAPVEDVLSLLEADRALKLTAAFGELPAPAAERIMKLAAEGRVEAAARPAGDPLLPLFYYPGEETVRWRNKPSTAAFSNDPFFIALRLSDARDAYAAGFKSAPGGIVSPPGGVAAGQMPLTKALGFKWLASGPLASTAPFGFIDADGVSVVPFSTAAAARAGFFVFDETMDHAGAGTRAALLTFLAANPGLPYLTVSEALKTEVSTALPQAQAAAAVAPWSGDYTPWAAKDSQTGALAALTRTRAELLAYLDAKQGEYKAAKAAFNGYFFVESGPKLLKLSDPDPETVKETEIEIQSSLADAYRLMGKNPPAWLFSPLSELGGKTEDADKVTVKKSSAGFVLLNALRPPVPPPAAPGSAPKGSDPYKSWKLARVEVTWTSADVMFSFFPLGAAEPPDTGALPGERFDLYIDVNGRPGAGSTRPLEGRTGRIFPDTAWEYALEVTPKMATLYVFTTKGPQKAGDVQVFSERGGVTARVTSAALRGNPGLWGYTAFMLYSRDARTFDLTDFLAEDFSNGYYYAVRPAVK